MKHILTLLIALLVPSGAVAQALEAGWMRDWSGGYAGLQFGNSNADDGTDVVDADDYGVHGGYLLDRGLAVYGGELSLDALDFEAGANVDNASAIRVKGLVGYDAGAFLPYLAAGSAVIDLDRAVGNDVSDSVFFLGVGAAYQVSDRFRVGVEYLRHDTDDFDNTGFKLTLDTVGLRASYGF
jgi:opacity protein-like surface antigen